MQFGVKVFQAWTMAQAQYRIHICNSPAEADLLVYLVSNQGMASGNGVWYMTPDYGDASRRVYFCNKAIAQFSVYFVKSKNQAGWQKPHSLRSMF